MLSILSHRGISPIGVNIKLSRVIANSSLPSARRSFLTSLVPRYEPASATGEPSAKKKSTAKKPKAKTAKETASKSSAKTKTKATGKVPVKKPVAKMVVKVAKEPKVEKPTHSAGPKLTKEDMPPKRPGSPYIKFLLKYRHGLSDEQKSEKIGAVAKDVGAAWNNMTLGEKQPFVEEYQKARSSYLIERQAYFDKVPSAVLKEINRRRKSRGAQKIHVPQTSTIKRATPGFFRFLIKFRDTTEATDIDQRADGRNTIPLIAKAAGEKWRALSEEAKAPYLAEAKKDMDAYHQAKAEAKTA